MRWIVTLCAVSVLGCAGSPDVEPESTTRVLTQADVLVLATDLPEKGSSNWGEAREPLKTIVWSRSTATRVRLAAVDALLAHDEDDTVSMLGYLLPSETDWVVIEAVGLMAVERRWESLSASLVRSLAREVPEPTLTDRPEYRALLGMHAGESIERIIYDVFADTALSGDLGERARQDAWTLLLRLDPERQMVQRLLTESGTGDDALLGDLRAAAKDLHTVPVTPEQVRWLQQLREPAHRAFWEQATVAISHINEVDMESFDLGVVGAAVFALRTEQTLLGESRESLLGTMRGRLAGRRIVERRAGDTFDHPERLETWEDTITWGELLTLLILDDAIHDAQMRSMLFAQSREDRADKTTEHGGLVVLSDESSGLRLRRFIPRPSQRRGDASYVAPPEMMLEASEAVACYHFHANSVQNSLRAGPSEADKRFARESGRVCIVVTSLRKQRLDIDVYFPSGVIVDLGVVTEP